MVFFKKRGVLAHIVEIIEFIDKYKKNEAVYETYKIKCLLQDFSIFFFGYLKNLPISLQLLFKFSDCKEIYIFLID